MTSEFYGREFEYSGDCLKPMRNSGRRLAELAIEHGGKLCDVGTGSGNIAITYLLERPDGHAIAVDISEAALRIAQKNAVRHYVSLGLVVSDGLTAVGGEFDCITANLPYWRKGEMESFGITGPEIAFYDGLKLIREIGGQADQRLKKGGILLVECYREQVEMLGLNDYELFGGEVVTVRCHKT